MGRVRKREADLLAPLAQRGAALTRERIQAARQNAKILSEQRPRRNRPVKIPKGAKAEDFLNLPSPQMTDGPDEVGEQLDALSKL
jgi:hypothetical protein